MSEFFVGQKVVCVDDDCGGKYSRWRVPPELQTLDGLKRGVVYTIAAMPIEYGEVFIVVCGITRPTSRAFYNPSGFSPKRFRPLEEKSDSIELFREIARGVSDGKPIIEDAEYRLPTPEKVRA